MRTMMGRHGARVRWLTVAAGIVLACASCGLRPAPGDSAKPAGSVAVVSGVVAASPGCPVERPTHPCPPRLLRDVRVEARPLAAGAAGRVRATRTNARGDYSLRLRQGRYL